MGKRRQYTNEFKLEAVKLVESSDTSMAQVARDLGIGETVLQSLGEAVRPARGWDALHAGGAGGADPAAAGEHAAAGWSGTS